MFSSLSTLLPSLPFFLPFPLASSLPPFLLVFHLLFPTPLSVMWPCILGITIGFCLIMLRWEKKGEKRLLDSGAALHVGTVTKCETSIKTYSKGSPDRDLPPTALGKAHWIPTPSPHLSPNNSSVNSISPWICRCEKKPFNSYREALRHRASLGKKI